MRIGRWNITSLSIDLMVFIYWPIAIFLALNGYVSWWVVFLIFLSNLNIKVKWNF